MVAAYLAAPGVRAKRGDAEFMAGLVATHGADRVRDAIAASGAEIGAANSPRHYLGAVVRNGTNGKRKPDPDTFLTEEEIERRRAGTEWQARREA